MVKKLINSNTELPFNSKNLSKTQKKKILWKLKNRYNSNYNPFETNYNIKK